MKQVWVNAATWSRTASTTAGALLPTVVTAMPEPRSMNELPSTSTTTPPPAAAPPPPAPRARRVPRHDAADARRDRGRAPRGQLPRARSGHLRDQAAYLRQGRSAELGSGGGGHSSSMGREWLRLIPTVGRPGACRKGRSAPSTDGDGAELRLLV